MLSSIPHQTAAADTSLPAESIVLTSGPCLTGCPVYSIEIRADGTARYRGAQFVAVIGERTLTLPRTRYAEIRRLLAPLRTPGEHRIDAASRDCGPHRSDQSSVGVAWKGGGKAGAMHVDTGCTSGDAVLAVRLIREALQLLPLEGLVYTRR